MDARSPSNSGKKKQKLVEEEVEEKGEEDEPEEDMANQSPGLSGVAIASCVFAILMIVGGVANLTVFIVALHNGNAACYLLEAFIITQSLSVSMLYPFIGFECGVGILAVLILIPGILIYRIKDPLKTVPAAVLGFISIIIALFISIIAGVTAYYMYFPTILVSVLSALYGGQMACQAPLVISAFICAFGLIAFVLTIISFTLLMMKRSRALEAKSNKPLEEKRVKKSERNVVSASKKEGMKQDVEGDDDDDSEEDEEEDSVGKKSTRGSDAGSESAEESETDKQPPNQTLQQDANGCLPPRYESCCTPEGPYYVANPFNRAAMDNGCMWVRPQLFQYNGRFLFSPTHF